MSFRPIDRLREGNINFLYDFTFYDRDTVSEIIRSAPDRKELVAKYFEELFNSFPSLLFNIIHDMDEYKEVTLKLFETFKEHNENKWGDKEISNILFNTTWGPDYITETMSDLISANPKRMKLFIDYAFDNPNSSIMTKLSKNDNLHDRALFMLDVIEKRPEQFTEAYSEPFTKFFTSYTGLEYEQMTFLPDLMSTEDVSEITYALFASNLDREIYESAKAFLFENYEKNDLAKHLLSYVRVPLNESGSCFSVRENHEGIAEFNKDADRLFTTSRTHQYEILKHHRKSKLKVSPGLLSEIKYYTDFFQKTKTDRFGIDYSLEGLFDAGLADELKRCVDHYLSISQRKDSRYVAKGSTATCFRVGDYIFKLLKTKWSYEPVICPNLYIIAQNLEEFHIRDKDGVIRAGFEVQKYLQKPATRIPAEYFSKLEEDLDALGYYNTDKLFGGICGENCRVLDSYKDADCKDPKKLPKWFKKMPLVLVDRDRIYEKSNTNPKQLREPCPGD